MKFKRFCTIFAFLLICVCLSETKKKHNNNATSSSSSSSNNNNNNSSSRRKTKTKTKWSTSTNLSGSMSNSILASEEHGYYIKRTFVPWKNKGNKTALLKSPPFLAIPIAWFQCSHDQKGMNNCLEHFNVMALNAKQSAINQGYLCDDDCEEPYEPICGKTFSEVAVFYNECKLRVAKCRSHGLWVDLPFNDCKMKYPKEVSYAEKKFHNSPYFRLKDVIQKLPRTTTTTAATTRITPTFNKETITEKIFMQKIEGAQSKEKLFNATDVYEKIDTKKFN